jgi:sugar/nucleoside kinase (ribokinase family)
VLCAVGDLIEDVVVQLHSDIQRDTDTPATITRRRGGSAANVAYFATKLSGASRFVGCVGSDALGDSLAGSLTRHGVDVRGERRGRTGSIVVVATADGARTMLTDRGSATELSDWRDEWLERVTVVHLPLYSFSHESNAHTSRQAITSARGRRCLVSLDLSSVALINQLGDVDVRALLHSMAPDVLFCTRAEADAIGIRSNDRCGAQLVVVKDAERPIRVLGGDSDQTFPVAAVAHVVDATGAGDALAAGFLVRYAERQPIDECISAGRALAARVVTLAGATLEGE